MTCKFQAVLFLTDSQSALSILSSASSYLLPESLWNVWSLASSLSNNTTLNFQWVPGHAGLSGNVNADLLAKAGASLPSDAIPYPLPTVVVKIRYFQHNNWRRHISHSYLKYQSPKSLRKNCSFLALFAVSFPIFAAMATVFFYLHIFTGSVRRRTLLAVPVDTLYRTSIISSSTVLPLNPFVNLSLASLSLFLTNGQTLWCVLTVGSPRSSSVPPSLGRRRVVPPPPPKNLECAIKIKNSWSLKKMLSCIVLCIITNEIPVTFCRFISLLQHTRKGVFYETSDCVTFMYSSRLPAILQRIQKTSSETRIMLERYYSFFHQCWLCCHYVIFQKQYFE